MTNFFLHNQAINVNSLESFVRGLSEFINIKVSKLDDEFFLRHDNLWSLPIISNLGKYEGDINAIYRFLGDLDSVDFDYKTDLEIDAAYHYHRNAYLGIDFSSQKGIANKRQIINISKASEFRDDLINQVSVNDIWDSRDRLFSNLVFCDHVKMQIESLTNINDFKRVVSILNDVNKYLIHKESKTFSCGIMNQESTFHMSPESEITLLEYGENRKFRTPDGNTLLFNYHLKLGNQFRIYIHQIQKSNKLYIGHIGNHLPTKKFN